MFMATASKSDKITVGVDDAVIELTGAEKEAFLTQREADRLEYANAIQAKASAKAALLSRLGITEEEAKLLLS